MHTANKLAFLVAIGRSLYSRWKVRHLLSSFAMIALLSVIAITLVGALMMGGIYAFYLLALHQGLAAMSALLLTGVLVLLLTVLTLFSIRYQLCRIQAALRTPVSEMADAFLGEVLR